MTSLLWSAAIVFSLLAAPAPQQEAPRQPGPRTDWVNDRQLTETLTAGAVALLDADRLPEFAELREGLKRRTCSLQLPPQRDEAAAPGQGAGDLADVFERSRDAVAVVGSIYKCTRCDNWHVSAAGGFFLTSGGALVTNHHVVDQADKRGLVAMTRDGRVFPVVATLAADADADVAIVQVEPTDHHGEAARFRPLPLAERSRVGQRVRVISHPDGAHFVLTEGIVSRRYLDAHRNNARWMTITADYAKGSSGGPVLDEAGRVAGIVSSTSSVHYDQDEQGKPRSLQMVWKMCVPVENIRALLEE